MNLKLSTWLVVALAGGALLAGCGSSSKSATSQTTSTAALPVTPLSAQQRAACKRAIQAQSISASAKTKLEQRICEKAPPVTGSAQRKEVEEACIELLNASHVPGGVAKERALAICKAR